MNCAPGRRAIVAVCVHAADIDRMRAVRKRAVWSVKEPLALLLLVLCQFHAAGSWTDDGLTAYWIWPPTPSVEAWVGRSVTPPV